MTETGRLVTAKLEPEQKKHPSNMLKITHDAGHFVESKYLLQSRCAEITS